MSVHVMAELSCLPSEPLSVGSTAKMLILYFLYHVGGTFLEKSSKIMKNVYIAERLYFIYMFFERGAFQFGKML